MDDLEKKLNKEEVKIGMEMRSPKEPPGVEEILAFDFAAQTNMRQRLLNLSEQPT